MGTNGCSALGEVAGPGYRGPVLGSFRLESEADGEPQKEVTSEICDLERSLGQLSGWD